MDFLKTVEDLQQLSAKCAGCFKAKIDGSDGKKHIVICGGGACASANSEQIKANMLDVLKEKDLLDKVTVDLGGCFGLCSSGPFAKIYPDDTLYTLVKPEDAREIIEKDIIGGEIVERLLYVDPAANKKIKKESEIPFYKKQEKIALNNCGVIDPENIEEAIGAGAFKGFVRALSMGRKEVIQEVLDSGLRGRGGAGFPTGRKWSFVPDVEGDKYIVCNGDEGDPGAFMDRSVLEGNPLAVIEGMMIGGYAIGASAGYFYVRAEYPVAVQRLKNAIKQAEEMGLLGDNILGTGFNFRINLRLGAGAFVCGEETALLNSIEGKRGMPRPRPPFPAVSGLWGRPTVVNNVETLACVPYVLREGAAAFAKLGTEKSKGTKVFALGGKITNVGLVEVPMGTTLKELIYDIGGGIPNGKKFKAIQTGGPSGGCLTAEDLDAEIDYDNLVARGSMMGSGGAIVMDEDNCMVDVAKFYLDFICDESCGKCSPCRIGTKRMLELLTKITDGNGTMEDLDELEDLAAKIKTNSLCGLGQTAPNPVLSTLAHFRDEYVAHIVDKKCPAHVCKNLMEYVIDKEKCIGCGMCAKNCPTSTISQTDYVAPGHKLASYHIDPLNCVKCGNCMSVCKVGAVSKQ
ncbi:MAG: NADH-quinone oxidoreductase subunit NuoF [Erysipelotrichaceae bacterium]|nr:NADH-quinone oxidoreductase subunit NuoF [Erysipelotrichaceae bacterium]